MITNKGRGPARQFIPAVLIALLLWANNPAPAAAGTLDDPLAEILTIVIKNVPQPEASSIGEVEIKRGATGQVEPGKVGMMLFPKDEVKTGPQVQVTLVFAKLDSEDRIEVMLKENSGATISSFFPGFGTFFISGLGWFDTTTRRVRLGKRGTEFEVFVHDSGEVDLKVLRGEVDVEELEPVAQVPGDGRGVRIRGSSPLFRHASKPPRSGETRTVKALKALEVRKDQPLPVLRDLATPEVTAVLDWTDNLIIASFPSAPPRNVIPTFRIKGTEIDPAMWHSFFRAFDDFKAARRKATFEPTAVNLATLGDAYKDFGNGKRSVVEYKEAVKVEPRIRDSVSFLANEAEAYRLSGNLHKANAVLQEAAPKLAAADAKSVQLYLNAFGNTSNAMAAQSILRGHYGSAARFFERSMTAYETADASSVGDGSRAVLQYNLKNTRLAFGPEHWKSESGPDLTGTYEGRVDLPSEGFQGRSVLVVTGNRFNLLDCDDSLTGTLVTRKGNDNETLVDFQFDSISAVKTISLKVQASSNQLNFTEAPGEKYDFAFSTPSGQRMTCAPLKPFPIKPRWKYLSPAPTSDRAVP